MSNWKCSYGKSCECNSNLEKSKCDLAYTAKNMRKEESKDALIELLINQVEQLSIISKIELGDDVIEEYKRLKEIINQNKEG